MKSTYYGQFQFRIELMRIYVLICSLTLLSISALYFSICDVLYLFMRTLSNYAWKYILVCKKKVDSMIDRFYLHGCKPKNLYIYHHYLKKRKKNRRGIFCLKALIVSLALFSLFTSIIHSIHLNILQFHQLMFLRSRIFCYKSVGNVFYILGELIRFFTVKTC